MFVKRRARHARAVSYGSAIRPRWLAVAVCTAVLAAIAAPALAANNPGTGDTDFFTFIGQSGDNSVRVNVASGNLFVETADLPDADPTYHVVITRYFNSLASDAIVGILGPRWSFSVDPQVKLEFPAADTVVLNGPSGYRVTMRRKDDGTYQGPEGFDGVMSHDGPEWVLDRPATADSLTFDPSGVLISTIDSSRREFTVADTSAAGKTVLSSYGTQSGRRANISYNGDSRVREIDDAASAHRYYEYTSGRLVRYSSPTGVTTYGYGSDGRLSTIDLPSGARVTASLLPDGRVSMFSHTSPGGVAEVWRYDYSQAGRTTVTKPDGSRRTYTYDDDYRVTGSFDPTDQIGPTAPTDFTADFDPDDQSGVVDWTAGQDSTAPNGSPESGVVSNQYRFRRGTGAYTNWQTTPDGGPGFTFPGAVLGEQIAVEARSVDGAGNVGAVGSANLVVGSLPDCLSDAFTDDTLNASRHLADSSQATELDSFVFTTPQTAAHVRDALPAGAKVVSVIERSELGSGNVHTSALTLPPTYTFDESIAVWNDFMLRDIGDAEVDLRNARGSANDADRAEIDRALDGLTARNALYGQSSGVPIKSFAVGHSVEVSQQIVQAFAGQLQSADTTVRTASDPEGCPAAARRTPSRTSDGKPIARAALDSKGPAETNVRSGSYSPPRVRVGSNDRTVLYNTSQNKRLNYFKVSAAWRFSSSANRLYWFRGPRRNDEPRGVEVQVEMDQGDGGGSFGRPPWGFLPPPKNSVNFEGIPGIWAANYGCAYADDYLNDNIYSRYGLTVGMACRPRSNRYRYRWAHIVLPLDRNDALRTSVQPVHFAQPNHSIRVPSRTERGYCEQNRFKRGSCFFGDHGVRTKTYDRTTDSVGFLVTPGSALFTR